MTAFIETTSPNGAPDKKAASKNIPIKYATVLEWVRISGMARTATYEGIARGNLRAKKLGRKTLIDVEHGLTWIDSLPALQIGKAA